MKKLVSDQRGNVAVIIALALPVLVGFVALVAEYGSGLAARAENQRVADLAAYAGAVAYQATSSTDAMTAAAARVASLNGIPSGVNAALVTSPRNASSQAVSVTITTNRQLLLAPIVGSQTTLPVSARAYAQISGSQPGCIIALSGAQTGVTLSGGTALVANDCVVASNATVTVPCGTSITATAVNYNSASEPAQPCSGIRAPAGKSLKIQKTPTADPLAGNAGLATAKNRHATVAALSAPAAPSAPTVAVSGGKNINFPWWNDPNFATSGLLPAGCTSSYDEGWIITCTSGGNYVWGQLDVHHVKAFRLTGNAATTFNFSGNLNIDNGAVSFPAATYNFAKGLELKSGASVTFGNGNFTVAESMILDGNATFGNGNVTIGQRLEIRNGRTILFGNGTFNIRQGLSINGGSSATFGAGTFNIGQGTISCNGAYYSICQLGNTLTFGGPSTFNLTAGIFNNGGSQIDFGAGVGNVYTIGPSTGGNALQLGGRSFTRFADSAPASTFTVVGHINVNSGGGSCLTLPAAGHHDIKGNLMTAGGTILGAGVYTVNGYVALGGNSGGSVECYGQMVGIIGDGVTFAISGTATPSGGSCNGLAFCVAAGYDNVFLKAPTTGALANLLVLGPTNGITPGAAFNEGAATTLSGALYFPTGPITLSGGASISNPPGGCMTLIGSLITLSGGTKVASACVTDGGSGGAVVLVQ